MSPLNAGTSNEDNMADEEDFSEEFENQLYNNADDDSSSVAGDEDEDEEY